MACGCNSSMNQAFSKNQLAQQVYETGFAIDDILLYLDTHPEDAQAIAYYQRLLKLYQNAIQIYEQSYGPLNVTQVTGETWNWIQNPWPWEGGAN